MVMYKCRCCEKMFKYTPSPLSMPAYCEACYKKQKVPKRAKEIKKKTGPLSVE